jgi:hypothetical protein
MKEKSFKAKLFQDKIIKEEKERKIIFHISGHQARLILIQIF